MKLRPYAFCDVENVDGFGESGHKNAIYCIKRNVTEFVKVCANYSKVGNYTSMKSLYGLVSVYIKQQK